MALENAETMFDRATLARICTMNERKFQTAFDMERIEVPDQRAPSDFYLYKDNGSNILAVAHLDTVAQPHERAARFVDTEAGPIVFSRALDDRLGAYTIIDMLPKLGINVDWLFTVGEESGDSTAAYFKAPKLYDWMIEFDRGGTDVVMYQYEDQNTIDLVKACGARPGDGIFSDISYLSGLGIKGFNWGVGYRDYHYANAHAYLNDYFDMIDYFQVFHAQNVDMYMAHDEEDEPWTFGSYKSRSSKPKSMVWTPRDDDEDDDDTDALQRWYETHGYEPAYHGFNDVEDTDGPAVLGDPDDAVDADGNTTNPADPFHWSDHWQGDAQKVVNTVLKGL